VLASASARRLQILESAGWQFEVQPADIDETVRQGESAFGCCERLAREKAAGDAPDDSGEPGDEALLGVVTLEILGLVFNPFNRTLQPMRMLLM